MYVRGFPKYYVKDGERRAVYYTAEVRDLTSLGWVAEESPKKAAKAKSAPEPATESKPQEQSEAPRLEADVVVEGESDSQPSFDFMTKNELLQYALDRGVDLPNNAPKAQLVEACKAL